MSGDNIGSAPVPRETDLRTSGIQGVTAEEVAALDEGTCPDCQGKKFLEGPHGGMSVNIECAGCGARFNIVPGLGGSFGKERIGRPTGPAWEPCDSHFVRHRHKRLGTLVLMTREQHKLCHEGKPYYILMSEDEIRELAAKLYAPGVKWKTYPNPARDDGVFVAEDKPIEPYPGSDSLPAVPKSPHCLNYQLRPEDAERLVERLNKE